MKKKGKKRRGIIRGKAMLGIMLATLLVVSILATLFGPTGAYSNGGPYNIIDRNGAGIQKVLCGQDLEFQNFDTTPPTVYRVVDGNIENTYTSTNNRIFDVNWPSTGAYYVNYGAADEVQLSVEDANVPLALKVDTTSVTSIARGTPLIVDTSGMDLFENDTVKLVITDPSGSVIKSKDGQVFDPVTVGNLKSWYGVGSAGIDTTNFTVGSYTFQIKTDPAKACGLDAESTVKSLAITTGEIAIEAEKTFCVELQAVRLTVTGVPGDDIHIASSPSSPNVVFRPGVDDTPMDATNQFNHTIDADGLRTYSVKFNDTGTFTIKVTVTSGPRAGDYDTVDITVSEKAMVFDVPSTVVIGEQLDIKGAANVGSCVDIFIDDVLYAELNNLVIEADGTFSKEVTTTEVGMNVPGSVMLKAWIDATYNVPGDDPPITSADGSAVILVLETPLNASLSKTAVSPSDSFEVHGNASSDYVELVIVSPNGGNGAGLDGQYGVSIYTVPTFIAVDTFSNSEMGIRENGDGVWVTMPITFDIPSTCIIGENLTVNGSASVGDSVDIAMDDIIKAVDILIENGTFYTAISTAGYLPGSYTIEGFIDGNYSMGEDVSGEENDGAMAIRLISPGLTTNLSSDTIQPGGKFVINGTATGADHVDIITISPNGGSGAELYEKSYPGVPGITNESVPVENNSFSKIINVSENADTGRYVIWVSYPGRDECYGNRYDVNNASELIKRIIEDYFGGDTDELRIKTQEQILTLLEAATIFQAGSDDLASAMELSVGRPGGSFYKNIKVDSRANTGNYTILVIAPGIDCVYGDSYYSYIDSILDLDGAGPELGALDVSNKKQEEIVAIIADIIYAAGSDDFMWVGYILVTQLDRFDTGSGTYPSIAGIHNGTITLYADLNVSTLYTYPCPNTGGHTEYARIWNSTWEGVEARWNSYTGNWHYIYFDEPFMLVVNETYNYTIRTGSYPQIHHNRTLQTANGWINCTSFEDVNGIIYNDRIPAVRLD